MHLSVQLRPWFIKDPPLPLPVALLEARQAGFEGVEIGAHYLDWDQPGDFLALLRGAGLRLSGVHIGGDIFNPENVRRVRGAIDRVATCVQALGAPFVLYSGLLLDGKTPADLESEARVIQLAAQVCARHGLSLLYHNHWWEIEKDYAYLRYIHGHTDPALVSFCLDLGWVYRAGGDPLKALDLLGRRARYFHVRDDSPEQVWKGLGEGSMELIPLLKKVATQNPAWVVIEQDDIAGSVTEAVGASRAYLREKMNW